MFFRHAWAVFKKLGSLYIYEPYTWALSVVAGRQIDVASWRPGAVECTVWNVLEEKGVYVVLKNNLSLLEGLEFTPSSARTQECI